MNKVVLASASPRRSELLRQIGIEFQVIPSSFEEVLDPHQDPRQLVEQLSYGKAAEVAGRLQNDFLVIGADTLVVGDRILGKPSDDSEACMMLKELQGHWHEVLTGLTVIRTSDRFSIKTSEMTRVKMRSLTDTEILAYVKTGEPADKAGAYGIQGKGALLIEKLEGCYFNVMGLPLAKLGTVLQEFGLELYNGWI